VTVDPDLGRVGEVGAELDEAGPELVVPDVEVVDGHAAVSFVEAEVSGTGVASGAVVARHHGLELLSDADGDDAGGAGGVQERTHGVDLALAFLELEQRDLVAASEGLDAIAEAVADVGEESGRGDGVAEVLGEEGDDLTADLEGGNVGVEVDAIEALEVEDDVLVEELIEVGHGGHGCSRKLIWMAANRGRTMAQAEGVKVAKRRRGTLTPGHCFPGSLPGGGHEVAPSWPEPAPSLPSHRVVHVARRSEVKPH